MLLQTAISWAEDKKLKDIYLGTTVKFLAAHRFYEKEWFSKCEYRRVAEKLSGATGR